MKKIGLKFMYLMRQIFGGTPVQKWGITTFIYAKLFHAMYGKKDIQTTYKGVELVLPSKDVTVVPSIIGGYFESIELDVFKELSKESKTVVDVGGNVGLYSILAAKNSKAKIYAFEPVPENIEYFEKNIELNKAKNISIQKKAVGKEAGKVKIYLSADNVGTHSAVQEHSGGSNFIEVPMTSLDEFTKKNKLKVDLLKVDVEGYDGMVYEGAENLIKTQHPTLFAEYAPLALKKCGYAPKKFLGNIVDKYKYCYLFEEKKLELKPITKKELLNMDSKIVENILLINNEKHKKAIQKYIKE